MPVIIPESFAQVTLQFALAGDLEPMAMTYGIDYDPQGDPTGLVAAAAIAGIWAAAGSPRINMSNQYTLTAIKLRLGAAAPPYGVAELPQAQVGANLDAALPQNCALLVKKNTTLSGREGNGRMYQPGVAENFVAPNGAIAAGTLAALQTPWTQFFSSHAGNSISMYLLHSSPQLGALPPPTAITGLSVDPVIATQRRRLRR